MAMKRPLKIAPGFSAKEWKALRLPPEQPDTEDWSRAIAMFEARMRRRFLAPADALIQQELDKSEKTFGFAILAIDCLVIETLQGFREGVIDHSGKSRKLFTDFLLGWEAFRSCAPDSEAAALARRVYYDCRCALLHSGATDGELRVVVSGPTFSFGNGHVQAINRTLFHESLKRALDEYITGLRSAGGALLRCNFKKKMDAISGA